MEHRVAPYTIALMRRWSEVADAVAATTKTSEKTAILADYLASLDADALPVAAVFLTGRPFPEADQRTIGLGWAGISATVAARSPGADRPTRSAGPTTARPTSRRR